MIAEFKKKINRVIVTLEITIYSEKYEGRFWKIYIQNRPKLKKVN